MARKNAGRVENGKNIDSTNTQGQAGKSELSLIKKTSCTAAPHTKPSKSVKTTSTDEYLTHPDREDEVFISLQEEEVASDTEPVDLTLILQNSENAGKERHNWAETFAASVQAEQKRLSAEIEHARATCERNKRSFESLVLPVLASALTGSRLDDDLETGDLELEAIVPIQINPNQTSDLAKQTENIMNSCRELLEAYSRIIEEEQTQAQQLQNAKFGARNLLNTFHIDHQKAVAAIEAGRKVAGMEIQHALDDVAGAAKEPVGLQNEEVALGKMVLDSGRSDISLNPHSEEGDATEIVGWGHLVYEMRKAMRSIQNLSK